MKAHTSNSIISCLNLDLYAGPGATITLDELITNTPLPDGASCFLSDYCGDGAHSFATQKAKGSFVALVIRGADLKEPLLNILPADTQFYVFEDMVIIPTARMMSYAEKAHNTDHLLKQLLAENAKASVVDSFGTLSPLTDQSGRPGQFLEVLPVPARPFRFIDDAAQIQAELLPRGLKLGDYGLRAATLAQLQDQYNPAMLVGVSCGIIIPHKSGQAASIKLLGNNPKPKYLTPPGPMQELYTLGQPDSKLVIITEGCFKAISLDKALAAENLEAGIIGLGGVTMWSGKKEGKLLCQPMLDYFAGAPADTEVCIVFDYDGTDVRLGDKFKAAPKYEVAQAEGCLAATLQGMGFKVSIVRIGMANKRKPNTKYAIDDYLLEGRSLAKLLSYRKPFKIEYADEALSYVVTRYAQHGSHIVDTWNGGSLSFADAKRIFGGPLHKPVRPEDAETKGEDDDTDDTDNKAPNPIGRMHKDQRVRTFDFWTYDPARPFGDIADNTFNLFKPWPPGRPGDPTPWLTMIDRVLRGCDAEKEYLHDWVAYLIQNPTKKVFTYIALVSPIGGAGKSLIAETVRDLFGDRGAELDENTLFGSFNSLLEGKCLVVVNELSSDKAAHVNQMKMLVTSADHTINEKFKPQRKVPNICNVILTSNELAPLLVSKGDRRDVIIKLLHNTPEDLKELAEMARTFCAWRDTEDGIAVIRWFYEQRDISQFNPYLPPGRFAGSLQAIELSKTNNQQLADEVIGFFKDSGLPVALLTVAHIMFLVDCKRPDAQQVLRELRKNPLYADYTDVMGPNRKVHKVTALGDLLNCSDKKAAYNATEKAINAWKREGPESF